MPEIIPKRIYNPLFEREYEAVRVNINNSQTKILLYITKERGKFSFSCGVIQQGFETFLGADNINCFSDSLEQLNSIFAYIESVVDKNNIACVYEKDMFKEFRQMAIGNYLSYHPKLPFTNGDNFALPKHKITYPMFFKALNKVEFAESIDAHYALSGLKHKAVIKAMVAQLLKGELPCEVLELAS